ncbi:MAG TPA: DUF4058 family protein [Anaerolineales bacterium]|nr:DUF4058 family protein [Anaerolineales bacterium]
MHSPFPGMDPYLEGYLWADVHQSLAGQIKRQLTPLLRPRYVARLAVYFVNDNAPPGKKLAESNAGPSLALTPPTLNLPVAIPLEVQLTSVHVIDVAKNELVTSIEILSPANKREPGLSAYRQKRSELIRAGVHLLEIDLIRRGSREWVGEGPPEAAYLVVLTRSRHVQADVWALSLQTSLPVLPVPLRAPDPDVLLDLSASLAVIYDDSDYHRTLDYRLPPPEPKLTAAESQWIDSLLRAANLR